MNKERKELSAQLSIILIMLANVVIRPVARPFQFASGRK